MSVTVNWTAIVAAVGARACLEAIAEVCEAEAAHHVGKAHGTVSSINAGYVRVAAKSVIDSPAMGFPQPRQNPNGTPCGECHLQIGETCDICGACQL